MNRKLLLPVLFLLLLVSASKAQIQFSTEYGGQYNEDGRWMEQLPDSGFIMVGGTATYSNGQTDFWLVRADAYGNQLWTKSIGGTGFDFANMVKPTPVDNGFIICGLTNSYGGGDNDGWIVKTDVNGNTQWSRTVGDAGLQELEAIVLTSDGGYAAVGVNYTSGTQYYDILLVKLNSAGVIQWQKNIGGQGYEIGNSIQETADHGFLIAAVSYSNTGADKTDDNLGVEQNWVLKIDSFGIRKWDKTIFSLGHNEGLQIKQTLDPKCYVVFTGDNGLIGGDKTQDAWGGFSNDFWIIKYCQGEVNAVSELNFSAEELLVYPNPFINEVKIHLNASAHKGEANADMYDILGHKILSRSFNSDLTINTSDLPKGIYILEVYAEGRSSIKMIVK